MQKCPTCGIEIDITRNLSGKLSKPGDVNICYRCGALLTHLNTGLVRAFDKEEVRRIQADEPVTFAMLRDKQKQLFPGIFM